MIPLHVTYRDFPPSDFVTDNIQKHIEKLERFCNRIVSCHVVVAAPHRHHHKGKIYHVQVKVCVPRQVIVVGHEPEADPAHEDVYIAIRDVFRAVARRLEDYMRKLRDRAKDTHHTAPHGRVVRLFVHEGYGFLRDEDGREIYFHRNSVLHDQFEALNVGMEVRFSEEDGDLGPQVSSMSVASKSKPDIGVGF